MSVKNIIFILLLPLLCFAQQNDRIVAVVGDSEITESEFRERFEFSAHPGLLKKADRDSVKFGFLKQLIAEKLLSLQARTEGLDSTAAIRNIMNPLENLYVRDKLYKHYIKDKLNISTSEIQTGFSRIRKILSLKFMHSKNQEELKRVHSELKRGASFDSLLALRKESLDQSVPRDITFGTMDEYMEDKIYQLLPGEYTEPVESKDGFYILKLIEVKDNITNKNEQELLEEVRKITSIRNEHKLYLQYHRSFFSQHRITAEREIFEALAPVLLEQLQKKYSVPDSSDKKILIGQEVTSLETLIRPEITKHTFIDLNGRRILIDYFLNQLSHEGFSVREINEVNVRSSLSSYIRKFIEDELLAAEAKKEGFDKDPDVLRYISMWRDSYLSKMVMINLFDSLKNSHTLDYDHYENYKPWLINIVEVLTDNLITIETVMNELARGRTLRELAKQYTIRDSVKMRQGELGLLPVTALGELGKAAIGVKIGEIYGPVHLPEGYSIFQVIEKKIDSSISEPRRITDDIIMGSALEEYENFVNKYNAGLAVKYGVRINKNILKEMNTTFLDMVVVRYMGFGGQIFAVPFTEQFTGWYELWQNSRKEPQP